MRTIKGTSGATVIVGPTAVYKKSPDPKVRCRLHDQARMMRSVGPTAFPAVYAITDDGYVMERLHDLTWTSKRSSGGIFLTMKAILSTYVWGARTTAPFNWVVGQPHIDYVGDRASIRPAVHEILSEMVAKLSEMEVTVVQRTHGDPTVDNVMERSDGGVCIIDPIPHEMKMPNLMASDLGKMLQSVHGYERVKYGGGHPLNCGVEPVIGGVSRADELAAKYFHVVHLLRLIPYQPKRLQEFFANQAHGFASRYIYDFSED